MGARIALLAGVAAASMAAPAAASAATITVNTAADTSVSQCTLRDAITAANTDSTSGACSPGNGSDTINFSNLPDPSTITLNSAVPNIVSDLAIQGPGAGSLNVHRNSGPPQFRIFTVASGTVTISGLTASNGVAGQGGGIRVAAGSTLSLDSATVSGNLAAQGFSPNTSNANGGGIFNLGTLHLDGVSVSTNTASATGAGDEFAAGAGIYNNGTLTIDRSLVSGNASAAAGTTLSEAQGGGIRNTDGTVTIDRTAVTSNQATATNGSSEAIALGGGIETGGLGTFIARRSTVSGNTLGATGSTNLNRVFGGGVQGGDASDVLDRVTVTGNSVSATGAGADAEQGGLDFAFPAGGTITSSTITANSAAIDANAKGGTFKNSIVSHAQGGGANCDSTASAGYNIDDGNTCGFTQATDHHNTNPLLDSAGLIDNGGPTKTIALQSGSPAIDQGVSSPGETTDQRGRPRPSDFGVIPNAPGGDGSDIGAFEVQDTVPPDTSIDSGPADGSLGNGPSPTFAFSSTEPGSSFQCSIDDGPFADCSSPKQIGPLSDGQHTFAVRAVDAAHNPDPSPASRGFGVDATPPDTTIDSGPADGSFTKNPSPSFGLGSNEAGSTYECSVDGGAFAACSSPDAIGPLADGQHAFAARATDVVGNSDPVPASRTFTVDTVPPRTTLVKPPKSKTRHRKLKLRFRSSEPGSTFECKLDRKPFKPCTSPYATRKLKLKSHVFKVRAIDRAGNADPSVAKDRFRVVRPRRR